MHRTLQWIFVIRLIKWNSIDLNENYIKSMLISYLLYCHSANPLPTNTFVCLDQSQIFFQHTQNNNEWMAFNQNSKDIFIRINWISLKNTTMHLSYEPIFGEMTKSPFTKIHKSIVLTQLIWFDSNPFDWWIILLFVVFELVLVRKTLKCKSITHCGAIGAILVKNKDSCIYMKFC